MIYKVQIDFYRYQHDWIYNLCNDCFRDLGGEGMVTIMLNEYTLCDNGLKYLVSG